MAIGTIQLMLDTFAYNHISDIVVVRGDYEARFIQAHIAAKGVAIPVSSTAAVTINARRPDGKSKSFYGGANEDGSVSVPLTQWMSDIVGRVECSISVVDNRKKISTTHFYIQVQEPPYDGSEISEDDPHKDIVTETYELLLKVEAGELKDAYGYAQEGGYTGSKDEFAEDVNPDNILKKATPAKGVDYHDGTSVTVSTVKLSDQDGGENVVTFSDGTSLTVMNGNKGSKGDKGETGASTAEAEVARDKALEAAAEAEKQAGLALDAASEAAQHSNDAFMYIEDAASFASNAASYADLAAACADEAASFAATAKDAEEQSKKNVFEHFWDGSVLTIKSARGESSADLKGDKGDKGDDGDRGERGESGLPTVITNDETMPLISSFQPNTEIRFTNPLEELWINSFERDRSGNEMWSLIFTADSEYISVSLPDYPYEIEWAVAEPTFTPGNTYFLAFYPFGNKLLGVWVEKGSN